MEYKDCPLCEMKMVSEVGKGCMMCGMPIGFGHFCCMRCENTYEMIHEIEMEEKTNGII